jgi:hypothetical protein
MLIVKSGLPGVPLKTTRMTQEEAKYVTRVLISDTTSFYYEPYPDDKCVVVVSPEHAPRVRQLQAEFHL